MTTRFDITALTNKKDFDHRAFIQWLYANIGDGITLGSIYELKRSPNKHWCWESNWGVGLVNKHEVLHIKDPAAANLFAMVWL